MSYSGEPNYWLLPFGYSGNFQWALLDYESYHTSHDTNATSFWANGTNENPLAPAPKVVILNPVFIRGSSRELQKILISYSLKSVYNWLGLFFKS